MSISSFDRPLRPLALMAGALLLSGCEWALGPLPARTNPLDLKAPVAYFRATPQASMEETHLTWKWGNGSNPGDVYILRGQFSAPTGIDDSSAELVYRSSGEGTSFVDDFGDPVPLSPDLSGQSYYYSMFYDDGERVWALEPSRAVFVSHTAEITLNNYAAFSFYYSALPAPTYGAVEGASVQNDPPDNLRYAILLLSLAELPAYNISVTGAFLQFDSVSPSAATATFRRMTTLFPEDRSPEYYYIRVTDPANYDTALPFTVSFPVAGTASFTSTELANSELVDIMNIWLADLNNYGFRIESDSTGLSNLSNFSMVVDYVGP
jgi:hypothetical protein